MDIKPIRNERDHRKALKRIEEIMDAQPGTPEFDELDVLATLVDAFETGHFPIDAPDPVEAIRFRMEQMGLTRKELEPFIGSRGRVSEVLSGRRPMSLAMIRKLHRGLGIPADVLISEYRD
ncbi:helix-turn-helix domain-containing protein [bacterium]|nr:helix-turn-helix domain-containing protein [bacterium]